MGGGKVFADPAIVIGAWPVEAVDRIPDVWPHCDELCRVWCGKGCQKSWRKAKGGRRRVALPGCLYYLLRYCNCTVCKLELPPSCRRCSSRKSGSSAGSLCKGTGRPQKPWNGRLCTGALPKRGSSKGRAKNVREYYLVPSTSSSLPSRLTTANSFLPEPPAVSFLHFGLQLLICFVSQLSNPSKSVPRPALDPATAFRHPRCSGRRAITS